MKIKKFLLSCTFLISLFFTSIHAIDPSFQELFDSFNYNYTNGSINVTASLDYMTDTNSNDLNDTLFINLTSVVINDGTFDFLVTLNDREKFIMGSARKLITASDKVVSVNFSTMLLESTVYNYSIEIVNDDNELVYRTYKIGSNQYLKFETGTNITKISDSSINNNFILINLTVNSTQTLVSNVTIVIGYNSSSLSKTEEKFLINGLQNISINIDNESIKLTHYFGNFTIQKIIIGEKEFNVNRNTSTYNYEQFAKTSYIKSITSSLIDTNNNNLSEFLEINFTINSTTNDTFNLSYEVYDDLGNFVVSVNKNQSLGTGIQIIQTRINGSDLYSSRIDGPYILSLVILDIRNVTQDYLIYSYSTNLTYHTDFERPNLPDLNAEMYVFFNATTNKTNLIINLSNKGLAPAFNVQLILFDNTSNDDNRSQSFLDVNQYIIYEFNFTNLTNNTLFSAILDFENLVDESNESNNIAQNIQSTAIISLNIESIDLKYSNDTLKIFKFVILNDGETTLTDIQWQFDTGNNYVINSTANITSLAPNQNAFIYIKYNYSGPGNFNIKANATGLSQSTEVADSLSSSISIGDLVISSFDKVDLGRNVTFQIKGKNVLTENINSINWTLDTGNNRILNSTLPFNLTSNKTIFIYVAYNYTTTGSFTAISTLKNGSLQDSESVNVNI